jgi:putative membrane protein insertion efficiency factor
MASLLVALLRAYQRFIGPLLPQACRFHPTCSTYAVEAIRRHGALRGLALTLARLARCGPWHAGGLDPVP